MVLLDENDNHIVIKGNAYFVGTDGEGNVVSLSNEQVETILDWIIDIRFVNILNFNFEGKNGQAKPFLS